jgi:hypothetical protein
MQSAWTAVGQRVADSGVGEQVGVGGDEHAVAQRIGAAVDVDGFAEELVQVVGHGGSFAMGGMVGPGVARGGARGIRVCVVR